MRTFILIPILFFNAILFQECNSKKTTSETQSVPEVTAQISSYRLEQVWATDTLLLTPESVIYDKAREVIYVSNVNQNPWEKDDNGFISKVSKTNVSKSLWKRSAAGKWTALWGPAAATLRLKSRRTKRFAVNSWKC